ncbi:hypothetical protein GLOIN_2v1700660 [Rhizophagus irregularis DAOM 181602=DAOM 197198]|nr:hypothetical protein GLOIN_2v1700660 [Rhizophagus irregularis DAOM 181602=DAOM 197198]
MYLSLFGKKILFTLLHKIIKYAKSLNKQISRSSLYYFNWNILIITSTINHENYFESILATIKLYYVSSIYRLKISLPLAVKFINFYLMVLLKCKFVTNSKYF